jgi:hypothetical protein
MGNFLFQRTISVLTVTLVLAVSAPVLAAEDGAATPSAAAMTLDATVVRPLSFATTIVGTSIFIISLPFTLLTHSVGKAGKRLVNEPARYTFDRPLGNFEAQTPGRK